LSSYLLVIILTFVAANNLHSAMRNVSNEIGYIYD